MKLHGGTFPKTWSLAWLRHISHNNLMWEGYLRVNNFCRSEFLLCEKAKLLIFDSSTLKTATATAALVACFSKSSYETRVIIFQKTWTELPFQLLLKTNSRCLEIQQHCRYNNVKKMVGLSFVLCSQRDILFLCQVFDLNSILQLVRPSFQIT
jgi:hypothetical protein